MSEASRGRLRDRTSFFFAYSSSFAPDVDPLTLDSASLWKTLSDSLARGVTVGAAGKWQRRKEEGGGGEVSKRRRRKEQEEKGVEGRERGGERKESRKRTLLVEGLDESCHPLTLEHVPDS